MQLKWNSCLRLGAVVAILLATLAACGPEANRPREGGLGADIGNHAGKPEVPASKAWSVDDP